MHTHHTHMYQTHTHTHTRIDNFTNAHWGSSDKANSALKANFLS